MANCGCNNNNNDEKVLSESGLRHIIEKLTGKMLLAVGTIKARGEGPLHLWRKYSDTGVFIHGKVDEATQESPGVMSAEDKARLDKLWGMYGEREVTITYEKPDITKFDYDDIPAEGGTVTPTIEFTQAWTDSEGNSGTLTQDDTDYDVEFAPQETYNGASINTTTGAVTKSTENSGTERAQAAVLYVKVTANGMESDTRSHTVYQAGAEPEYTYGTPTVHVTYDNLPNEVGATIEPKNWYVTQTKTGNDGSSEPLILTDGFEKSFNANDSGGLENAELNEETGVITCTALNETTEVVRIGLVNVQVIANGVSGSTKINIYQEAGEVVLPEIHFVDLNQNQGVELTDASLISLQEYAYMRHEEGTAMTIGVSLPTGSSGVYTFSVGIWFDCVLRAGNVTLTGEAQYICQYHGGQVTSTELDASAEGTLESIYHGGESGVAYGDGYYRLEISNASLATASGSSAATLLELDLLQYYVDAESGTTTAVARANRYLRLDYAGDTQPTSVEEFISNIRVSLVER